MTRVYAELDEPDFKEVPDIDSILCKYEVPLEYVDWMGGQFCDCLRKEMMTTYLGLVYNRVEELDALLKERGAVDAAAREAIPWLLASKRWNWGPGGGYKQVDGLYNVLGTVAAVSAKLSKGRELAERTGEMLQRCEGVFHEYLRRVKEEYGLVDKDLQGYVSPVFVGGWDVPKKFNYDF